MELLAPAGSLETACAAFEYGADAVYLGLHDFSARADAVNFSLDEVAVLMGYARRNAARPGKVYVAVNTLLRQDELPRLIDLLGALDELKVDALIVQDFAVAQIVRRHFPGLRLHASTQMTVHNRQGVLQCREMGFERVIASREVTLAEMSSMAAVPGMELEVFVHGALCYAYSGLCLLSSVLNGHSGNRGECSYVCRNAWDVSVRGHRVASSCNLMSMKDLCLASSLPSLEKAGVASIKIEGRKKTPLYVAAVTNYYRRLLDHSFADGEREQCEQDLKVIFARPWTKFFLGGERSANITDIATTGPRGSFVGEVGSIVEGPRGDSLRFMLKNLPLEKHDGLQVEIEGRNHPFGFPVDELSVFRQGGNERSEKVFSAEPDTTIEVPLPAGHPELKPGQRIYCTSSQKVRSRYHWPALREALVRFRHKIDCMVSVQPAAIMVTASLHGEAARDSVNATVRMDSEKFSIARKSDVELTESARKAFDKLGDSPYALGEFAFDNPGHFFVPVSLLNELRRQCVAALQKAQKDALDRRCGNALEECSSWRRMGQNAGSGFPKLLVKVDRPFAVDLVSASCMRAVHELIFDFSRTSPEDIPAAVEHLLERLDGDSSRLRLALPAIWREHEIVRYAPVIRRLFEQRFRKWQIANAGHLEVLREAKIVAPNCSVTADWQMHCTNAASARFLLEELNLQRVTLAPDDTLENHLAILARCGECCEVPLFQDTPLAVSAVCANASLKQECAAPGHCDFSSMELTDRRGNELIAVNNRCQSIYIRKMPMERFASKALYEQHGAHYFRIDFINRDWAPAAVPPVLKQFGLNT